MGLQENLLNEQVSRLALRKPITVSPNDSIRVAIEQMRKGKLGCVVVVDEALKPLGVFTESMLTQLLVQYPAALEEPLKDHLSERWPWVSLTDKVADVLEAMQAKNVRFLCVLDKDGVLVGLTGQKGLMEYVAEHFPGQVMVQRIAGTGYSHEREGA